MKQVCNDDYWKGMLKKPDDAPCGRIFDDFDHMTYCPHPSFPSLGRTIIEEVKNSDGSPRIAASE